MDQDGCSDPDLSETIDSIQLVIASGPKVDKNQAPSVGNADIVVTDHQSSQQIEASAAQSPDSVIGGPSVSEAEEALSIVETEKLLKDPTLNKSQTIEETQLSSNSTDLSTVEIVESKVPQVGTIDSLGSGKISETDQLHSAENIERAFETEKIERSGGLIEPDQTTASENIVTALESLEINQPSESSEPSQQIAEILQQSAETSPELSDIIAVTEVKKVDDPKPTFVESGAAVIDSNCSSQQLEQSADTMKEEPVEVDVKQEPIDIEEDQSDKGAKYEMDDEDIKDEEFSDETNEKDDDEIVDNPAYIPKTGRYYMHDSREVDEHMQQRPSRSRADGQWKHDRFDVQSQRPKSRRELLTRYGYDIRSSGKQEIGAEDEQISETGTRNSHKSTEKTHSPPEIPPARGRGGRGRQINADRGFPGPRRHDNRASSDNRRNAAHDDEHDGRDAHRFDRGKRSGMNRRYQQNGRMMRGGRGDYGSRVDRYEYAPRDDRVGRSDRGDHGTRNDRDDYVPRGRPVTNGFRHSHSRGNNDRRSMRSGRGNIIYTSRGAATQRHEPHQQPRSGAPGGKRYSTQRVVGGSYVSGNGEGIVTKDAGPMEESNAVPPKWNGEPLPPQQQHVVPSLQQTMGPPPPLVVGPPPLGNMQQPPPATAPMVGYPCNNIVYFDPHQQINRNPMPPRSRKRLEIVPPSQKS